METSALEAPIHILLSEQSHEYHDHFWPALSPICSKIGGQCARDPEKWPPGTLIPVVLTFDYDWRRDTNRKRFTLVDAQVPTFAGLLDITGLMGRRSNVQELSDSYLETARVELAKMGLAERPPSMFAFWFVWKHADDVPRIQPWMRFQGFSRFVGIYPKPPGESFDYKKEFLNLLGPLPVVSRPPNRKERRKEERNERFSGR